MVDGIVAKLVLLGDGRVGKTSLRRNYMGQGFEAKHLMTIGADFALNTLMVDDTKLNMQIWDVAGQATFTNVRIQ